MIQQTDDTAKSFDRCVKRLEQMENNKELIGLLNKAKADLAEI
jgi:hypothetical protein